ncbi:serine/threonine-protein kinase [Paludisphaera borealis]|uniref:Serine/threonine-protein kinase PknB n=1 Tax=Paludisphaera borealis TaxID=1387353 RepID=A0A1U7CZA3_9BACT|nr:serine/threonine-protein kinase [Paludisphaera borealis]APW64287.1 Serine/threonine-protein kinase PknB [Paludisphaera borealis]
MDRTARNADELFFAALEIDDPEARESFLVASCGPDAGLRDRVERLLAANSRVGHFLEPRAAVATIADSGAPLVEGPGTVIGPYKLLEAIGEGGMGVVYMAEQVEPVRRKVALKVVKPGMDSRRVLARFEAERQALAMMDHPNIAKVLDAGSTDSGHPYFVMELVKGVPITDYSDREQLSIPERLDLFVLVCRAVQHAHQKGIIHRDLKPSNILVTIIDGAPVPKVIDFGVAKATGDLLTDKTLFTGFAQLIGTPLYMSPEQAQLTGVDVDTRSDIYSMGVLLYELLTGTTPFDEETLRKAAFDEMRRIIREEEPPKPSTRLSVLGELLTTTSAKRKADPRRLGQSLRGELDWIVMKALEKDRRRRYETANDFAADVMRHLADQPVEACPPSAFYRLKKFSRRNRVALATSGVIAAVLISGGAVSTWQAIRANQARRDTEGALATARQAVDEMYTEVAEEWLGGKPELNPLQRKFLEKALMFYEGFAARDGADPAIRHGAADAADRVGNIRARLGLLEQAIVADRQALTIRKELAEAHPDNSDYWRSLTGSYDQTAIHLSYLGKRREAEQEHNNAIESIERILQNDPTSTVDRNRLGMALINQGITLAELGRNREAEQVLQRSCDHFERLTKEDPGSAASYQNNRSFALSNLAGVWREAGRFTEAEAGFKKVLEIQQRERVPDVSPGGQAFIGSQLMSLAAVYSGTRRHQDALDTYRQAINTYEKVVAGHPERHATRHKLILCRTNQTMLLMGLDRRREAEEAIQRFLPEAEKLVEDYPAFAQYREAAATVHFLMADLHSASSEEHSDDPALAQTLARRAVELAPESGMARQSLGWALYRTGDWKGCVESFKKDGEKATDFFLAMAYWRLGDKAKAREVFDRSSTWLVGYEQRWTRNPNVYPIPSMQRRVRAEAAALMGLDAATPPEAVAAPK